MTDTVQHIAIRRAREMPDVERATLRAWFEEQFGSIPYEWARPDWYAVARNGETLLAQLAVFERTVSAGNTRVHVGGIGSVVTKPEHRRRGVATALLRQAASFIRDELRAPFGLLLCRHEVAPVYAKVGWIAVPGPTLFAQSWGTFTYPRQTMVLPCGDREWPPGPIDLCGLPW